MPYCKYCGKFSSKKYCSNVCRNRFNYKPYENRDIKYCLFCGEKLPIKKHKYCNSICRDAFHLKNKPKKFCKVCGKEIGSKYIFCSTDCQKLNQKKRDDARN